ncbi:MAG: FYDLN acid domain-containing protein [Acidobacteria bacterium]|nr:FYDLN acid domain-containing protein [Acidobacteriota bacterium]
MPQLGRKYTCYSCHTKFYDLGKPTPICPKCGADQRDAEETPVVTSGRGRSRVVEEPAEEPEFPDAEGGGGGGGGGESDEEEDAGDFSDGDREEEADDEEEEDY